MLDKKDISYKKGKNWTGKIYGICPVQGEGLIFNYRWNFRSRGSHYQIDIPAFPNFKYKKYYGEFPSAGYISHEEAWKFIENALGLLKKEYKLF